MIVGRRVIFGVAVVVVAAAATAGTVTALGASPPRHIGQPAIAHLTGTRRTPRPAESGNAADRTEIGGQSDGVPPISCGHDQSVWGYLGLVQPGDAAAVRQALGGALLAQVTDHATGQVLDLTREPAGIAAVGRWLPVYPQDTQPQLLSCDYMLTGKPADLRLTGAAIAAFVRAGYFRSAGQLRANLQAMYVSADPAARGEVLVTLDFAGPPYNPTVPKGVKAGTHPVLYSLVSYTAIEQQASAKVTGLAAGGF